MKGFDCRRTVAILALILLAGSACAADRLAPPRLGSPQYPYNEHTPAYEEMIRAQRAYEAGQLGAAFTHYRNAARWADKFGQFNVGVMYLRGEHVEFDALRGWAWVELAAERGYPGMRQTADAVWDLFNERERRAARGILEDELLPVYGDEVAIERTARKMDRDLRDATGSRTGSRAFTGFMTIIERGGRTRRGDEFYDPAKWDFRRIVAYETDLMLNWAAGNVELGELELIDEDESPGDDAGR